MKKIIASLVVFSTLMNGPLWSMEQASAAPTEHTILIQQEQPTYQTYQADDERGEYADYNHWARETPFERQMGDLCGLVCIVIIFYGIYNAFSHASSSPVYRHGGPY